MLPSGSRRGLPLPVRNAGESPVRSRRAGGRVSTANGNNDDTTGQRVQQQEQGHYHRQDYNHGLSKIWVPPSRRGDGQRSRGTSRSSHSSTSEGEHDPEPFGQQQSPRPQQQKQQQQQQPPPPTKSHHEQLRASHGSIAVDRGLTGVAASLRSSWSTSSVVLPPMPNGEAVPALLSHLAGEYNTCLRSVCKRQRESGRSMRGALVRKQGQLDDASAEASWLRAELGYIVGDMLGSLQRNPTAGAIFSSLSERIRSDLGAEEAAVYIDIGDGTLWLLPTDGGDAGGGGHYGDEKDEVFIQRGVGVVGLVAMGALPGVAAVAAGGGERAGGVDGGVDVLLLNEGLEAFDNGTTVEAELVRAARRRRSGRDGRGDGREEAGEDDPKSGTVKNMLLARVGSGMAPSRQTRGGSVVSPGEVRESPDTLPEPPTAVIQALNKRAPPERFTEGDARAVRTLAPAIAAGSRLIVSLLKYSQRDTGLHGGRNGAGNGGGGGDEQADAFAPFGRRPATDSSFRDHPSEELVLLREGLRRAREGLGADRARLFVLGAADGDSGGNLRLQLLHEDPPRSRPAGLARSSGGLRLSAGGIRLDAGRGLHGVALSTGRAARAVDALSDPLYDRELDVQEGFLARSAVCAPLLGGKPSDATDEAARNGQEGTTGVLEFTRGSRSGMGASASSSNGGGSRTRKPFVDGDERLAEAFARDVAGLLSRLLAAGFRPRAPPTTLAGGAGHLGSSGGFASAWGPTPAAGRRNPSPERRRQGGGEAEMVGVEDDANEGRLTRGDLELPSQQQQQQQQQQTHAHSYGRGGQAMSRDVEGQDRIAQRPLGCSTTSTAVGVSPLGMGVRASLATVGQQTPDGGPPPPSPATAEGSPDGGSPPHHPSPRGQASQGQRSVDVSGGGVTSQALQQQQMEAVQARSWAAAHGVLELCKESLAADKRSRQHQQHPPFGRAFAAGTNAENLATTVRSLVSSLLPGCGAALLLLDRVTGRLREAGHGAEPDGESEDLPTLTASGPPQNEDVARRALASGKALLSRLAGPAGAAVQDGGGDVAGRRVFCVPVGCAAERHSGVLQLFLPPPPDLARSAGVTGGGGGTGAPSPSSPPPRSEAGKSLASPRAGSPPPLPPPPPSFFMAAKVVSDSVGLALGWCEALDWQEKKSTAERSASAKKAEAAARARER
ncbi:unnamed protein product, partial [Hapterophycus canaliculatus]